MPLIDNETPSATISSANISERLPRPERGDRISLTTESLAFEGKAVARREDGYVIFVEGALAQERIVAEIKKAKSSFAEATLIEIIAEGPDRRKPICPYFGMCGGCSLQHINYAAQLQAKKQQVIDLFQRVGKIPNPPVRDMIAAPNEYHYRNKMEFSFSNERWLTEEEIASGDVQDRFALGLHVRERFNRVIDTEICYLPKPVVTEILDFTRQFTIENHIGVYSDRAPEVPEDGAPTIANLLRFLVIKTSHATGEIMVNLVTSREESDLLIKYTNALMEKIPSVTTVVNNINTRRSQVSVGDYEIVYHGEGIIRDKIGNAEFRISANSFFQANTVQAERLYSIAAAFAELKPDDSLWDLYCGTGTISLFVANKVKTVLGIELVESAIIDARANAKSNGISNVEFISSDLRKALVDGLVAPGASPTMLSSPVPAPLLQRGSARTPALHNAKPDVMIIDPPRNGMHADVIQEILKLAPERIAYISCNPATQARDIALLAEGYELLELQPVDMFPQTYHIECVAKLRKRA